MAFPQPSGAWGEPVFGSRPPYPSSSPDSASTTLPIYPYPYPTNTSTLAPPLYAYSPSSTPSASASLTTGAVYANLDAYNSSTAAYVYTPLAADAASPSPSPSPDANTAGGGSGGGSSGMLLPHTIGISLAGVLTIAGIVCLGVWCRVRRRKVLRIAARDMRQIGREDGMGHFAALGSNPGSRVELGEVSRGRGEAGAPPRRPWIGSWRGGGQGVGDVRRSMAGTEGSSAWEDDSEADMMATDGSTLARTLSGRSASTVTTSTVIDHPGYTYHSQARSGTTHSHTYSGGAVSPFASSSRSPVSPFTSTSISPFADPHSLSDSGLGLGHAHAHVRAGRVSSAPGSTNNTVPAALSHSALTLPPAAATLSSSSTQIRANPRSRAVSRLSTISLESAATGITAISSGTRATLPEYTLVSDPNAPSPFADVHAEAPGARGGEDAAANPFGDPLPSYEGTFGPGVDAGGALRGALVGAGAAESRRGPPAYSAR